MVFTLFILVNSPAHFQMFESDIGRQACELNHIKTAMLSRIDIERRGRHCFEVCCGGSEKNRNVKVKNERYSNDSREEELEIQDKVYGFSPDLHSDK